MKLPGNIIPWLIGCCKSIAEKSPELVRTAAEVAVEHAPEAAAVGAAVVTVSNPVVLGALGVSILAPPLIDSFREARANAPKPDALNELYRKSLHEALEACTEPVKEKLSEADRGVLELWLRNLKRPTKADPMWSAILAEEIDDANLTIDPRFYTGYWPVLRKQLERWTDWFRQWEASPQKMTPPVERSLKLSQYFEDSLKANLTRELLMRFRGSLTSGEEETAFREAVLRKLEDIYRRADLKDPLVPISHYRGHKKGDSSAILLSASYQAFPFTGRTALMDELWKWLEGPEAASIRVISGRGGSGKSRTGFELLRQIQERSPNVWHAGFLDRDRREYLTTLKEWAPEHPTLIIVDYASEFAEELEAVGRYLREMERGTEAHPYRLRVLLLERTADAQQGWFHSLRLAAAEADKLVPNPIRLQEETFGVLEREALFQHGLKVFAHHRGEPSLDTTGVKLDPLLSPDAFRDPLVILMAAAVSQERKNLNALALNRVDLAKEIAKHEEGRLSRLGGDRKKLLLHMAGFVTLTGKLARTQLMDACAAEIDAVQKRSPWTADELADVLQDAGLPSTENDWAVEPITPDIVGEAFVLNAWRQLRQPPEAAVLRAARASAGMVTRTLVRMVQDFADEEQVWAVQQLSAMLQDRAAGITDVDFWEIQAALPLDTVLMREPARDFYASVARARDGQRDQVSLTAQEQFAIREAMLGHPEIALRSMTEVVEIRRRVVREKDSEPTRAALASSLNNQASQQSEMGQRGAALATIEEAVIHYRKLAAAERETFLPNLAKALNNLSTHQSKMGQRGAALATIEEAVQYRRELVAADREAFLPNLATALNNRGHRQSEMGQLAEALVSIEEAVRHHRELVAANREAFLPDLARAINSLANLQGNMGQRAEALASIEEAVRHYCELAAAHPEAFLPYLATSHGAWGQILQDAGDAAAASEKFAEGVRMMTPLAQQLPQAHFELTLRLASAYEKACEEADLLPDPEITWPLEVMRQLQEEQNKPESE